MTWEATQDARKRQAEALNAGAVFEWGLRDRALLSPLVLEAAEAVGLKWDAVNLVKEIASVRETRSMSGAEVYQGTPKHGSHAGMCR